MLHVYASLSSIELMHAAATQTVPLGASASAGQLALLPVQVSGAGRTDAGTHAIGQAASFRAETALPTAQLLRQLRARLPEVVEPFRLERKRETYARAGGGKPMRWLDTGESWAW